MNAGIILVSIVIFSVIILTPQTFAQEEKIIPPPQKQMKLGIKLGHIICDEDKIPTWNVHYKPACVFPDSEMKLLTRGWAKLRLVLPASGDPIKELEWTGQNEVTYRILGNLRVGDEPPPSTLEEKRKIAWEYAQKYHPGERFLEYSITPHQKHYNVGEKIQFDLLEWGNYSECWNLNIRIFDPNNEVLYEDSLSKGCLEPDGIPGTFHSYSIGKDSNIVCEKPGYYLIEVSNGEIFLPAILQNFACLDSEQESNVVDIDFSDVNTTNIVDANNQFALDFYSQVTADKKENVFFSPWSISTAFSIAYEGARGTTAEEIGNVFGFIEDNEQRRSSFSFIQEDLNQKDAKYKLNIANALWLAPDFEPFPEYVSTAKNYYDSEVDTVNFAKDGVDIINEWVNTKTEGKIEELFEPGSLDSRTRLVITNAIYFNGTWVFPFDKELTTEEDFFINAQNKVSVQMMNHEDSLFLNYTETEQLGILALPYEGDKLSMLILLPHEIDGITSLEESLSAENISEWNDKLLERKVRVQLPKFTMDTDYDLVPELKEMGINAAFGPADFSGISNTGLFIEQAIHKAFVDVNEVGTEAAAATGISMRESGPQVIRADHPFMFLIQDNETGNILFIGKVMDPTQ